MLFADELVSSTGAALMSKLKFWVTERVLPIRQMYCTTFNVDNHMNIILATNKPDCIKMAADDRRFTIIQTPPFKQEQDFYTAYHDFLKNQNGAAKVMHYLLNLDLTGFNPKAEALKSSAKDSMTNTSASDLNRFIRDLMDNEDNECDFLTAADVLVRYRQDALATNSARSKVNMNSVIKEFDHCRFLKLLNGERLRASLNVRRTFYAARNQREWDKKSKESPDSVKEHIAKYYKEAQPTLNTPNYDVGESTDF
jgi:hypothetical protein